MHAGSIWWAVDTSLGVPAWALVNRKRVWNIFFFCAAYATESFKKYDPSSPATLNTEIWFKSRPACVSNFSQESKPAGFRPNFKLGLLLPIFAPYSQLGRFMLKKGSLCYFYSWILLSF